jgi:excisionase family DNA binding protein
MSIIEGVRFYTIQEVAKALLVTPQTIRAYVKKGKIKGERVGVPILISEDSIKEFIKVNS